MMTVRTYAAIPGICLEPGEVVVPNDIGSHLCCQSMAVYIKHDFNPPEHEWQPLEIPPDEPEPERPDPGRYTVVERSAKRKSRVPRVGSDAPSKDNDGG